MPPSPYDIYTSPLATRNASAAMQRVWSARHKFNTWRRVWLAVAEAQHEAGLPVRAEQVAELREVVQRPGGISDAEMQSAERHERDLRHDVMAHVHALGEACPRARPIIHLGLTSEDVGSNADALILMEALRLSVLKLHRLTIALGRQGERHADLPTLGFTHYQPAQPLTVGRRLAGWAHDAEIAAYRLGANIRGTFLRLRGLRGATGTQASFLALAGGDAALVEGMERGVARRLWPQGAAWDTGICDDPPVYALSGQTYPRVIDALILADLAAAAAVLHKIATDVRLLCNLQELDEPFETRQVGSSAMPYKRNPMRCERACGLARFVMNLAGNAYGTAATQWLERTLDDSSNRRLALPESFLALDGALDLMHNVASGLIVHQAAVTRNLRAQLPFLASENLLMECVRLGGDRQRYHEIIRVHSQAAGLRVKDEGLASDLLDRLRAEPELRSRARGGPLSGEIDWDGVLDPRAYLGRSAEQTRSFVRRVVEPLEARLGRDLADLDEGGPRV